MDALRKLEDALAGVFKNAPALPAKSKQTLAEIWPWLALVFGILQLAAAYSLYRLGHTVNALADYANQFSTAFGGDRIAPRLGLFYWLGLAVLVLDGVILLVAYSGLKNRSKRHGWNLIFLSALLNLAYGVLIAFDGAFGGLSRLVGAVIGSAIAFYLLFQVRELYKDGAVKAAKAAAPKDA
jgi:hypothetical protein